MTIARAILCTVAFALCAPVPARAQLPIPPRVGWYLVNGRWLRANGACDWSELVSLNATDQSISADVKLSDHAAALLKGGRMVAVEVGAGRDLYNVTIGDFRPPRQRRADGGLGQTLSLRELVDEARVQKGEHAPLRPIMLVVHPGAFRIVARGLVRGTPVIITFMCTEARGNGVDKRGNYTHFSVNVIDDPASPMNFVYQAETFGQLLQQHPTELRKFLSPVLRRLGSADPFSPGPADVYGAFPEIDSDPAMREKIAGLLPRLGDPDPRQRQHAFEDLRKLGGPGACAAVHWPDDELDPQQQQLIRQFLRSQSHRHDQTPQELRRDPMFLIDCLEYDDKEVRELARAELERVLARTIQVDPARADACATLAAKLREELLSKRG